MDGATAGRSGFSALVDGVAGAVGRGTGAHRLLAAEVLALAAEGALIDAAVFQAGERYPGKLQLGDPNRRSAATV